LRHAYLIVANGNWGTLNLLIQTLDASETDFFILVDKKVKEPFAKLIDVHPTESKIFELPRIQVNWGGYSQIRAEFLLLEHALSGKYDYYHYLQGSDFPIKNKSAIDGFFSKNSGMEFIQFAPENYEFAKWKCAYKHILIENRFYRNSVLFKAISHGFVEIQKCLRRRNDVDCLYHGSALFSITHEFASYVVSHEDDIRQRYRKCLAADEVFLQTLIMKSPFKDNVYHFESDDGNARYIDWKHRNGSSPKTLDMDDFDILMALPEQYCFARKFSDSNIDVVKRIARRLSAS
jgi:hypothetical protein